MKAVYLDSSGNRLHHAMKTLRMHWDAAQADWDDPVSRDFETKHLLPLEDQVRSTLAGANQLADVMRKMVRDCS